MLCSYNHVLFRDYKEAVATVALQTLLALLNHAQLPSSSQANNQPTSNVFLQLVRELNSPEDFKFLYTNIARLLTNPLATQTYVPHIIE